MNIKSAAGLLTSIIIFATSTVTTTLGHYAEVWIAGYPVGLAFAVFGGLCVAIMVDAP